MAWPEMTFDDLSADEAHPDLTSQAASDHQQPQRNTVRPSTGASCAGRTCACAAMSRRGV